MMRYFKKVLYLLVIIGFSVCHAQAYEEFFRAVNRDDGRTVTQWLDRGFDPNSRDPKGQSALHLALRDGQLQVAEALWVRSDLDVNVLNAAQESPLMMAALKGRLDWAQRLLARGANVHQDGWSPIHYAAASTEPRLASLLLERGAPIEAQSPNRTTPLMMAAGYGSEAMVDLFLARGADVQRRNDRELNAADFARQSGREFLLTRLAPKPR